MYCFVFFLFIFRLQFRGFILVLSEVGRSLSSQSYRLFNSDHARGPALYTDRNGTRAGLSVEGTLYNPNHFAAQLPDDAPCVFYIGAMASGHLTKDEHPEVGTSSWFYSDVFFQFLFCCHWLLSSLLNHLYFFHLLVYVLFL